MAVLDVVANGMLVSGLLVAFCGVLLLVVLYLIVSFKQPDFWQSWLYIFRKRLDFQNRLLNAGLKAEKASILGRLPDFPLRWATGLLIFGGILKATIAIIERQST